MKERTGEIGASRRGFKTETPGDGEAPGVPALAGEAVSAGPPEFAAAAGSAGLAVPTGVICGSEDFSGFEEFTMPVESIDRHHRSTLDALLRKGTIRPAGGVVQTKALLLAISIWALSDWKLIIECVSEPR